MKIGQAGGSGERKKNADEKPLKNEVYMFEYAQRADLLDLC